jgi:hypothetical protein
MKLHRDTVMVPPEREIVTLYTQPDTDHHCYCDKFGQVHGWHAADQATHRIGNSRACIHRFVPMPSTVLIATTWVENLNWQLHIVNNVMASRTGDVLTLAIDVIGPVADCTTKPQDRAPHNRWCYRLYHIRWWDEDDFSPRVLLGVAA